MAFGAKDREVKAERRPKLDGGLNSRANPLNVGKDQVIDVLNVRLNETGTLRARRFAAAVGVQQTYGGDSTIQANPPTLTQLVGGGTLAAGTYQIAIPLTRGNMVTAGDAVSMSLFSFASIVVNLNDRIQIDVVPNNGGEAAGQGAAGRDDPFNGGQIGPVFSTGPTVFKVAVKKVGDPDFTLQTVTFTFTAGVQRATLSAYAIGTVAPVTSLVLPVRHIVWHPSLQRMFFWVMDVVSSSLAPSGSGVVIRLGLDKNNKAVRFSRLPTKIYSTIVQDILVATDGIGRPKFLSCEGSFVVPEFRLAGAPAPAAPTLAGTGAGGAPLAGTYKYVLTNVYVDTLPDNTTLERESNSSAIATIVSGIAQNITVTLPAATPESGITFRRVYRTTAGGGSFFKVGDAAAAAPTFLDTVLDTAIGTAIPPDAPGLVPNDVPPNQLYLIGEHLDTCWAVLSQWILGAGSRIIDVLPTNTFAFAQLAPRLGTSEAVNAWPAINRVRCGDSKPINAWQSLRGQIYVFKSSEIGVVTGDRLDNFAYSAILHNVGAMRHSSLKIGTAIYFWDPSSAAMSLDGARLDHVGYEIQPKWLVDRAAGFYPWHCWFDRDANEVHWVLIDLSISTTTLFDNTMNVREYVFHVPTRAWSVNDGVESTTFPSERFIWGAASVVESAEVTKQIETLYLTNGTGRIMEESAQDDTDGSTGVRGTASATFRYFFGEDDNFAMVKQGIVLDVYSDIPNAGSQVVVKLALLGSQAFVTVATLVFDATRLNDRIDFVGVPAGVFANLKNGSGFYTEDRGLIVRVEITGQCKIKALYWKTKDITDEARAP